MDLVLPYYYLQLSSTSTQSHKKRLIGRLWKLKKEGSLLIGTQAIEVGVDFLTGVMITDGHLLTLSFRDLEDSLVMKRT